jgi:hypothetical protein
MATEIAHEPTAARKPLDVNTGTDAISGILNRELPEEPEVETPEEVAAPEAVEEVQEQPEETPVEVEAKEEPAKEPEDEVTSEIELEPSQVAQMLGLEEDALEVDEDGAIHIHAKVDGKPAKVPLKDLRHSYELAQTHEERLRQLGRDRKSFQEESNAALERLSNQHQQFSQAVGALEEDYATDFKSVDWTLLRTEDPTEYNLKRADYEDRRRRIEEYKGTVAQQSSQLQAEYAQKLQERQAEGARQLAEAFQGEPYRGAPEWNEEEGQKLQKWIVDQGFTPQDIASVGVWQVFKWARDSMLRESELKQAKETVKKVVNLPKVSKPGKPKAPSAVKKEKVNELKGRQRKSGGGLKETTDLIGGILNDQR